MPLTHEESTMAPTTTNQRPYEQAYFPMVPTSSVLHWRKNVVWQAWRFVMINLKMMRVVRRSHH
jgi:hypothetical protein